jgi:NAD(P)-dependent dehydrogenase (short-subunit alcohol dehydrogenase family)
VEAEVKALVTGGTRGVGAAIVEELARWGHSTHTFSRSPNPYFIADATDQTGRQFVKEHVGHCGILVNNVGGGGRYGTDAEVWAKNVDAMIDFTQWAISGMAQRGWGRVVTISSIHGREYGSRPIFMAAKAAQIAYMKGMSRSNFARCGVTFNTVCPGNVSVAGKPDLDEAALAALPMGRMGKPDEVAKLVVFLCSNYASWINGSTIVIDGGESHAI